MRAIAAAIILTLAAPVAAQTFLISAGPDASASIGVPFALHSSAVQATPGPWGWSPAWTVASGPKSGAVLVSPLGKRCQVRFSEPGVYTFRLSARVMQAETVTYTGEVITDEVSVTVGAAPSTCGPSTGLTATAALRKPKLTAAGSTFLQGGITVVGGSGYISDYNGLLVEWTQVSGPASKPIINPTWINAGAARFAGSGTYVYRMRVRTDGAPDGACAEVSAVVP